MSARRQESSARVVVETAVDGVILIDARGNILVFNPACEKLFGYSSQEVVGQNVKMLMPEPYRAEHDGYLANYQSTGVRKIIGVGREVVGRRKDGSTFPMYLSVGEAKEDGEFVYVGIIRDLSERKRAELALEESERSFRLLVEGVTDYALFMLDLQGRVANWNTGAQRIKQYTAEDVIGLHFRMFYDNADRTAGAPERALEEVRAKGKHESEGWRVRKDGSRFWASVVIDPVRDESGAMIGFVKITRDISERRRAESALIEGGARLRAVVETAVDGVIMIDAQGVVSMFNPACERLFGYEAAEVVGQNVKMLMPEPYRAGHDGYIDNYRTTGDRKIIGIGREVVGRRKDGSTFPMDLSVGEAKQGGESIFVGIIHDLTSRKRTEQQLAQAQKMETVGQLSGGIAHDFNNLLTVILGNAEALSLRLKAREDLRRLSDTIVTAAERGAELTQRLLAFSRRQVLQPLPTDCNVLLGSMQILLKRTLRDDVELHIELAPTPVIALADPGQLESAILNLVLNAQDAMPQGGALHISAAEVELDETSLGPDIEVRAGRYVMLCVTDNGTGMPEDVRRRVFEPFFTTKEVGKGSGLGLSMVYGFANQSNGHVAIYSEVGLGTSVRIYLPVAISANTDPGPVRPAAPATPGGVETILVVEDDSLVRSHAVSALESMGYRVLVAADSRDALAVLRGGAHPDLLFTDVVMPGGASGWDLAKQALAFTPGLKVLFTSGYPLETLANRMEIPANASLINKPYRMADLARRVRDKLDEPDA